MKVREIHQQEPVTAVNTLRLVLLAGMTFGLRLNTIQLTSSMIALEALLTFYTRSKVSPRVHNKERRGITKLVDKQIAGIEIKSVG